MSVVNRTPTSVEKSTEYQISPVSGNNDVFVLVAKRTVQRIVEHSTDRCNGNENAVIPTSE